MTMIHLQYGKNLFFSSRLLVYYDFRDSNSLKRRILDFKKLFLVMFHTQQAIIAWLKSFEFNENL